MNLRRQLADVIIVRLLLTLAAASLVLAAHSRAHGLSVVELIVAVAVVLVVNVPFLVRRHRGDTRLTCIAMVVVDLAAVTVAVVCAGGVLSATPILYVWPIATAALLIGPLFSYAVAGAASALYVGIWQLQANGILTNHTTVAGGTAAHDLVPVTAGVAIGAYLFVAILTARRTRELVASRERAEQGEAAAGRELVRLRVANEQVRAMGESSRVFLRYQQLDKLMPNALAHVTSVVGGSGGFVLVHNRNSGQDDEKGAVGDMPRGFVARLKELGVVDLAREGARVLDTAGDTRSARLLKAIEQTDFHSLLVAPLATQEEHLGMVGVFYRRDDPPSGAKVQVLVSLCGQLALVIKNMQYSEELRRMNEELTHLDELKSDFMATMSHELRTPLTSIIGYSDMLMSGMTGELNEKQTAFVDSIVQSGETLLNLINDNLDLTKIESGRLELMREPVDLRAALLAVLPFVKPRAAEKSIKIATFLPTDLPAVFVDPGKFNQILLNLLTNGVKFSHENGSVSVEARAVDSMVEIRVVDSGIGIAKEDQERIFERFTQIDSSATRAQGGTGLGLAIVKELVELHGGAIRVQSKVGKGSSFIFTVPRSEQRADQMSTGKMS
jgi:signal transduction histidine kinase